MNTNRHRSRRECLQFLLLQVFVALGLAVVSDRAEACSCSGSTVEERLSYSDVVVTGEIERIERRSLVIRLLADVLLETAVLRVDRIFKGEVGGRAEFTYDTDEGMCGLSLSEGQSGVFLLKSRGGRLSSELCLFDLDTDVNAIVDVLGKGRAFNS